MSGGNDADLTPRQRQASVDLDQVLQGMVDAIGVDADEIGDDPDYGLDEVDAVRAGQLLTEWVLCAAVTDSSGRTWITQVVSPSMPTHHAMGLLHRCLYE